MIFNQRHQKVLYIFTIVICMLVSSYLIFFLSKKYHTSKELNLTTVEVISEKINIGQVPPNGKATAIFQLKNTGKSSLKIEELITDCDCTAANVTETEILPGDTAKIFVSYNKNNIPGFFHRVIQVDANIEKSPIMLTFRGEIDRPLGLISTDPLSSEK